MSFLENYQENCARFVRAGAEIIEIGKTFLGRSIYAFEIGCGSPKIIAQYAIHAREHITYFLALKHLESLLHSRLFGGGTVYIIPVVNVDGVALCLDGVDSAGMVADNLIELNRGTNFSLWKANARGVDLNVNFDARWGNGAKNVTSAGPENYIGSSPNSEPETRALIEFTKNINPDLTLSFHAKGEVVYWDFHQKGAARFRGKKIGRIIADSTGYRLVVSGKSTGGYKDWCIQNLGIPSYTIEVGAENLRHPIGLERLPQIYYKTSTIFQDILTYLKKQKCKVSINI